MRLSRINPVKYESWAQSPLPGFLRRHHLRVLGFRETAWCYAVGLTTAIFLFWQPDGAALSDSPIAAAADGITQTQLVGTTKDTYKRLRPASTTVIPDGGRFVVAVNAAGSGQTPVTYRIRSRSQIGNPRALRGKNAPRIHVITTILSPATDTTPETSSPLGTRIRS